MSDLLGVPIAAFCPRTNDPDRVHIAGSTPSPCRRCKVEVMVSPAMRRRLRPCDWIICVECACSIAEERNEPWTIAPRNADQLAELAANGREPKQF